MYLPPVHRAGSHTTLPTGVLSPFSGQQSLSLPAPSPGAAPSSGQDFHFTFLISMRFLLAPSSRFLWVAALTSNTLTAALQLGMKWIEEHVLHLLQDTDKAV